MGITCQRRSTAGTQQDEARGNEHGVKGGADSINETDSLHAMLEESFRLALDTRWHSDCTAARTSPCITQPHAAFIQFFHILHQCSQANSTCSFGHRLQLLYGKLHGWGVGGEGT